MRLCSNINNDTGKIVEDNKINESSNSYEDEIKIKILQSSLAYVPQHGWSVDSITAGINF